MSTKESSQEALASLLYTVHCRAMFGEKPSQDWDEFKKENPKAREAWEEVARVALITAGTWLLELGGLPVTEELIKAATEREGSKV